MAITAKFAADFAAFQSAVDQADVKLAEFEGNSNKVTAGLTRMANSLSGTNIIQQATLAAQAVDKVGGVAVLTQQELARVGQIAQEAAAKLQALGQEVPPKIQNLADAFKKSQENSESFFGSLTKGLGLGG